MPQFLLRPAGTRLRAFGQGKPGGNPLIEWGHPLSNRLISYWWNIGARYTDLVTGATTVPGSTRTTNAVPIPTAFGVGGRFNSNTQLQVSPANTTVQNWVAPFSFAVGLWQIGAAGAATSGVFGVADSPGNDPFIIYCPTTTTFTAGFGNAAGASNFTFVNGTFYVIVGSASATTTGLSWINGIAQTNFTGAVGLSGSGLKYVFGGVTSDEAAGSGTFPNSIIFFAATWLRALNSADANQLYTDPYCFLLPAEPEMMIIQAAAVAAQEEVNWSIFRPRVSRWGH